jgi:hypothetical protein
MVVRQQWEARLLAITGSVAIANMLLLWNGLNSKKQLLDFNARYLVGKSHEQKKYIDNLCKGVLISAGFLCFFALTLPLLEDCVGVSRCGELYLIKVEGRVYDNDMMFAPYFIQQTVFFSDQNYNSHSYAAIYFQHSIKCGKSYQFLIAPHGRIILQAVNME